jgi:Bacterial mobilisation protein (MobC)
MARYERSYSGPRRTAPLRVQLTPDERAELEKAAEGQGAPNLSTYARELLFRRSAAVVAATKRNPEAKALAAELRAIGINLNQISRHANSTGEIRDHPELREVLDLHKQAMIRVLDL